MLSSGQRYDHRSGRFLVIAAGPNAVKVKYETGGNLGLRLTLSPSELADARPITSSASPRPVAEIPTARTITEIHGNTVQERDVSSTVRAAMRSASSGAVGNQAQPQEIDVRGFQVSERGGTPEFGIGDKVTLAGEPQVRGTITSGPKRGAEGPLYEVILDTGEQGWRSSQELCHADPVQLGWVQHRRFLRDLAVLKLNNPLNDVLYSVGSSRTKFLVYQFQPVLKFVQTMPHGLLIADEVGLGKTIEAGLILKELIARGSVQRVLVVCPANLRTKWQNEMENRFNLAFQLVSTENIRSIKKDVERGEWPAFMYIASLEGLRRDELQEILQETKIHFDLVIIDEAHHLRNRGSLSFDLGELLSEQCDHLLLLSATPLQTSNDNLLSLLRLIEPAHFTRTSTFDFDALLEPNAHINQALKRLSSAEGDPPAALRALEGIRSTKMWPAFRGNPLFAACENRLRDVAHVDPAVAAEVCRDLQRLHTLAPYFTRTRKREVEEAACRRSRVITVQPTPAEHRFYVAILDHLKALAAVRTPTASVGWVVSMRERQAASSLYTARQVVREMLAGDAPHDVESTDADLAPTLASDTRWMRDLDAKRAAVERAAGLLPEIDTKMQRLVQVIRELRAHGPQRKILLFTFFKGTLRHLHQSLTKEGITCYSISGDDKPEDRADIKTRFQKDERAVVLLSTEVGAEGLDFQFCDTVINYDLPWNPMRVEQRIGRVDRYGQRSPYIDVVSFFVEGTIDTRILQRLYERIEVFESSIGELEPILGDVVNDIQRDAFSLKLSDEERLRRLNDAMGRMENLRQQERDFEHKRAELFGYGDWLRAEVEATRASGRFISAPEMEALVSEWLAGGDSRAEGVWATKHVGVRDLCISETRLGQLREWMLRHHRRDAEAKRLFRQLTEKGRAHCTFDGETAQQHEGVSFIDSSHPIVRVALDAARQTFVPEPWGRVCSIQMPPSQDVGRDLALFLYRLDVSGLEPRSSLLPIAVALATAEVLPAAANHALGALPAASDARLPPSLSFARLQELEEAAFLCADIQRTATVRHAAQMQAARVAARKAAIERTFDVKIQQKQERLKTIFEPRIRRLHEGEIRNLTSVKASKLAELDRAPQPSSHIKLEAVVVITIGGID